MLRAGLANVAGGNPYAGQGPREVISGSASTSASGQGEFTYSNLGMSLLGQALVQRMGTTYPKLVRQRVLAPADMPHTQILTPGEQLPEGRAHGQQVSGQPAAAWRGWGYAPAGVGVYSTAGDMARYVEAVMRGQAPGSGATKPRFDAGDDRIGLAWLTSRVDGHTITWHNGGTGGFRSFVGFDRENRRAVVVLGAETGSGGGAGMTVFAVIGMVLTLLAPFGLVRLAVRRRHGGCRIAWVWCPECPKQCCCWPSGGCSVPGTSFRPRCGWPARGW